MKIAVCVKYVPVIARIKFDYEQKTIVREGVPSEVNPFDLLALVRAVELKRGPEDQVVPPNQAETMVEALKEKGLPVAYVPFEGEQHGFRRAENIKRCLDLELYFYSRIFGFTSADQIEPVEIMNLPENA